MSKELVDLEKVKNDLGNDLYKVLGIFEELEHKGVLYGNGHHMSQKVIEFAQNLIDERNGNDKSIELLMKQNPFNFPRAFRDAKAKKWDKIFVFCDIHDTILEADYNNVAKTFVPKAKEVLQQLSKRKDISLGIYTCSYPDEITEYVDFFAEHDIVFEHINRNDEVAPTKHGCFDDKPYMNVLLEDKAGFMSEKDWYIVEEVLKHLEPLS